MNMISINFYIVKKNVKINKCVNIRINKWIILPLTINEFVLK